MVYKDARYQKDTGQLSALPFRIHVLKSSTTQADKAPQHSGNRQIHLIMFNSISVNESHIAC
jgi:hypothetical protein